jgi:hypothetical protein
MSHRWASNGEGAEQVGHPQESRNWRIHEWVSAIESRTHEWVSAIESDGPGGRPRDEPRFCRPATGLGRGNAPAVK